MTEFDRWTQFQLQMLLNGRQRQQHQRLAVDLLQSTNHSTQSQTSFNQSIFSGLTFYAPQLYRQVLLRRVLAMGILSVRLSVRLSVTTRWYTKPR